MLFAVAMLLVAQVAFSQNITLKFTGATNDGRFARLDSVQVQNVSRSWSETVVYPDTVLIFQQTGIADAQGSTAEIASYPNPFNGTTNVAVTMPQSGEATLQLYNLAGQRVAERTIALEAGKNLLEVRLQTAQVYLLALTTAQGCSTIKLLNRGEGIENGIVFRGNANATEKRLSTHIFHSGDVLKITGFATHNGIVITSREVLQPQTASENFTLFFTLPVAPVAPTVTTTAASSITSTTATSGGNVTSDGGSAVTTRGVCWSTSQNPTVSDSHTSDGSGTGSFTSSLTGLSAGTTYYVRAYAINSVDTAYGNQITFTTAVVAPTVTTTAASSITSTTATSGGNVTSDGGSAVTARGVCWSTSQNPTLSNNHTSDGSGTGSFTSSLTGLTPGSTYYVRAYAINSVDTAYGNQITFTTSAVAPTVTTTTASGITDSSATTGGNVTSDGGSAVTARGVCWSTSQNPTLSNSHTTNGSGTGIFTSNLTGLTAGTTYYVRAYAINSVDTAYGNQITFTTTAVAPTVTTIAASNITSTSATSGGNVTSDGGSAVTARGVCWGTSQNPTINCNLTTDSTGTGSFTSSLTGLNASTTYYVRAYAINSVDTAYGNQITFTTTAVAPTITTTAASNITSTSATSGGNVTSDGGSAVTARGICWDTSQNPTINGNHTTDSTGLGTFISSITGLVPGTTYYVRAYAINSVDTAYGNQITFTTAALPSFSVSASTRVLFSPGNLQWNSVAGWRFALNQWDTLGALNNKINNIIYCDTGWIDLFGWGTSGNNNGNTYYAPNSYSRVSSGYHFGYGYGPIIGTASNRCCHSLTEQPYYDWGYNNIYNPQTSSTDSRGTWRTLTGSEWEYIINNRITTSGIRFAKARVNGINGLILTPDNWSASFYALNSTNTINASFSSNVISAATWTILENFGCIFLPAAGERGENYEMGNAVNLVYLGGTEGSYWSSTYSYNSTLGYCCDAVCFMFSNSGCGTYTTSKYRGLSVRLVKDVR